MEHVYIDSAVFILSEMKLIYENGIGLMLILIIYTPFCGSKNRWDTVKRIDKIFFQFEARLYRLMIIPHPTPLPPIPTYPKKSVVTLMVFFNHRCTGITQRCVTTTATARA